MSTQTLTEGSVPQRLAHTRELMRREGIHALLVPSADPHLSEYLPGYWQGRQWLSGFHGSVGTLIVTPDFAGVWADSRYWEQATKELNGSGIELVKLQPGQPSPLDWLAEQTPEGGVVAVDGAVMAVASARTLSSKLEARGARLRTDIDLLKKSGTTAHAAECSRSINICRHRRPSAVARNSPNCAKPCRSAAPIGTSSRPSTTSPGCSTCVAAMCRSTRCLFPLR